MQQKLRLYMIARRWGLDARQLADLCRLEGIKVVNQLTVLDEDLQRVVEDFLRKRIGDEPPDAAALRE